MSERSCQLTGEKFAVPDAVYEQFGVPLPNVCPEERFRRSISFKSGKQFYHRRCDLTQNSLYSIYPLKTAFPIASPELWNSEKFDPFFYGQGFDFKRLFMEQLLELWRRVPRPAYAVSESEHSRLCDRVRGAHEGFLLFDSFNVERSCFSNSLRESQNCVDCYQLSDCSFCYESIFLERSSHTHFSEWCSDCRNSLFLFDCQDCEDCLFCVGLRSKRYHIFNEAVSPEEFRRQKTGFGFHAAPLLEDAKNKFRDFLRTQSIRATLQEGAGSVSGNYLRRSKDVDCSFEIFDSSNVWYSHEVRRSKDVLDSQFVSDSSHIVQSLSVSEGEQVLNSIECDRVRNVSYSSHCRDSSNLFACIGLRNAEYCIFNQPYSQSDYEKLFSEISTHMKQRAIWGVPLPVGFSGHAYNRSSANEYMPLTKVPAKVMGFQWDDEDQALRPSDLIGGLENEAADIFEDVPEHLTNADLEKVSKSVYLCSVSGKPFQLSRIEVELLVSEGLAPPRVSFQQRHLERLSKLTPHELNESKCSKSGKSILSAVPTKWKQSVHDFRG